MMYGVMEMGRGKPRVKLGSLLEPVKGKKYPVGEGKESGKYPLLRSSKDGKVKWMDTYEFEGPYITAGTGGYANFNLISKFNASTETLVFNTIKEVNIDFIYYLLAYIKDDINESCFQGTGLKHLNRNMFMDLEIPLPSLSEQQTLQSDFDEIRHKHEKIARYKAKAQESIERLIPGANVSSNTVSESHSSICQVQADGTGCTCRTQI